MKQKGFENREVHMGLSILPHNLWVAGEIEARRGKSSA